MTPLTEYLMAAECNRLMARTETALPPLHLAGIDAAATDALVARDSPLVSFYLACIDAGLESDPIAEVRKAMDAGMPLHEIEDVLDSRENQEAKP
jgi:hypothetical protein